MPVPVEPEPNPRVPSVPPPPPALTPDDLAVAEWQLPIAGLGESGQRRLKAATVLVTRVGGLGGVVAQQLAAAGIGRLVLAHGGDLRPSDLNRQILMSHRDLGQSRIASVRRRLTEFNPRLELESFAENVSATNVRHLVSRADVIVDCAPLFEERYLLNGEAVAQRKPMVEAAVHDLEFHLTTLIPGQTPCLRCLYPQPSTTWTRRFPVVAPVPGMAGSLAALEVIKLLTGLAEPLAGRLLVFDLRSLSMRKLRVRRLPDCPDCQAL